MRAGHDFPDHPRLVNIARRDQRIAAHAKTPCRGRSVARLTLRRRRFGRTSPRIGTAARREREASFRRGPTWRSEEPMTGNCAPGLATQWQCLMGEQIGAGAIGRIVGHDAVVQGTSFAYESVNLFGPQEPVRGDALRSGSKLGFIIVVVRVALSK